jgi:hypothetical protein
MGGGGGSVSAIGDGCATVVGDGAHGTGGNVTSAGSELGVVLGGTLHHVATDTSKDAEARELALRWAAPREGEWTESWCKPHPDMLLAAMKHHQVDPAHTLMIGYDFIDQEAASKAGVDYVDQQHVLGVEHFDGGFELAHMHERLVRLGWVKAGAAKSVDDGGEAERVGEPALQRVGGVEVGAHQRQRGARVLAVGRVGRDVGVQRRGQVRVRGRQRARGRAEREERELREGETAARGEANKYILNAISGTGPARAADPTLSDTAIPGEIRAPQEMSSLERMQQGLGGLSPEAQAYVSPMVSQMGLDRAFGQEQRQEGLQDYAAQQAIDAQFAPPPEWNTVNVREGNEQVTYAYDPTNPQNRIEIARGAAFSPNQMTGGQGSGQGGGAPGAPRVAPISIQNRDYAAIQKAQEQSVAAAPGLQALERTIGILSDPEFDSSGIFMPETGIINNVMAYFGSDAAKQTATDIALLQAGGAILGIAALQGIGGSDTERELAVATRTGFNPRGTAQENLALAQAKQASLTFAQEYPMLASEWVQKYGSLHPSYTDENGQTFSQFANNKWQQIKDQTGATEYFSGADGAQGAPAQAPAQGGGQAAPTAPEGVDAVVWQNMTPAERALWQN